MRFTVIWTPAADNQLTDLWTQAPDRQAVTDAVGRIGYALRNDPEAKTVPFGRFFTYIEDPLAVLLEIDPGDCMVRILQVRFSIA